MQRAKHHWKKVPDNVRKPTVFVVGILVVLSSGLVGWLPGPGGIPIFLLGIAILASEFAWADRLKQAVLNYIKRSAEELKNNPVQAYIGVAIGLLISCGLMYLLFFKR